LPHDTDIAIILNPAMNAMELLATVCDELGIAYDADKHTLKTLTDSLHSFLLANHARGRKTVLLIDEAQHLDFDVLEQIRLLTNLETHSEKLLQIILIGQPELAQMLARPELRQLNQRITARYNLEPLNLDETGAYIRHRLQVAGMNPGREVFPASVVKGIHRRTRGIPRLINVLCDRMLLGAYGRNKTRADHSMLQLAAREVMGEAPASFAAWAWPAAIAGLMLVAVLGWWLMDRFYLTVPPEPVVATPPLPAAPAIKPEAMKVSPAAAASSPAVAGATVATWLLPPAQGMARLWALSSAAPLPPNPCVDAAQAGLACVDARARTWDQLAEFDRPLLLDMITTQRFAAAVLLLGTSGRHAWVAAEQGVTQVELAELGPLWTGGYRFLWHPPQGFDRPLGLGDDSPVVARVAALFARLDGQQQALSGTRFNQALQQRVRLFQRQHALEDDGMVGVQTLLRLNTALGIDPTAAQGRAILQQSGDEGVTR
jgi:general secretion pathway protein A